MNKCYDHTVRQSSLPAAIVTPANGLPRIAGVLSAGTDGP